jgi:glycerophosphoryl diester phosphodiesterase
MISLLIVIAICGLTWMGLYTYGLKREIVSRSHPFNSEMGPANAGHFQVIAHRGGALEAPENTIFAFESASKLSKDMAFELDIHLTKDNELVVLHDSTVDRTTDGKGKVSELTFEELSKLDAAFYFTQDGGQTFPLRGTGIRVPKLSEVLEKFPTTRMIIEGKVEKTGVAEKIITLVKEKNALNRVVIASEHPRFIREALEFEPQAIVAASRDMIMRSVMLDTLGLTVFDPMYADLYCVPESEKGTTVVTESFLKEAIRKKRTVFVWTVNDVEDMKRLKKMGVDGVITDAPSVALGI